jgi:type III pantothenate kinase
MILCDIGNTTFHFLTSSRDFKVGVKESIKSLFNKESNIYFISVNQNASKKLLKIYPNAVDLESFIDFKTSYKGMGIDRKIACKYIPNGIIVDFGSAITIDVMKKGIHQGGFILPGISSYVKIYPKISKKLKFKFDTDINLDKMPMKTDDAINYSILSSIILPIKNVYAQYSLPIYFTGEDSQKILNHFKSIPYKYKKNLVFNSMKKVMKENRC